MKSWNVGKKQEFSERKLFTIDSELEEKSEELDEIQGDW